MRIKHAFTSAKIDGPDDTVVQPGDWNDYHVLDHGDRLWRPGSNAYGLDDEFDDGTLAAAWLKVDPNPVRATWTEGHDVLSCYVSSGNAAGQHNAIVKPISLSPPYTVETAYRYMTPYAYNYFMAGIVLSNSSTWGSGQCVNSQSYTHSSIAVSGRFRLHWQNPAFNADTGNVLLSPDQQWTGSTIYAKLVCTSSTSFSMYISPDGVSWHPVATNANPGFSLTPTYAGLYTSTWAGAYACIGSFEYFRVY